MKVKTVNVTTIEDAALEPFFIRIDDTSHVVLRRGVRKSKTGIETPEELPIKYVSTVQQAIDSIIRLKLVRKKQRYTLGEFLIEYGRIANSIKKVINEAIAKHGNKD